MPGIDQYDAIVIGAGQAGGPLASALARAGLRTAIVEREHVGGTCVNEGCTPTKTMIASARAAYLARRGSDYGVLGAGSVSVDMARVRRRKRDIVDSFRGGSEHGIETTPGLDLIRAEARFTGAHTVAVRLSSGGERELAAPRIFINTGERPAMPPIPGLAAARPLTSTTIMELDRVPEHLIILGGGYVGMEFGQMFRRFGSRVTIIQRGAQLLPREDEDIAAQVANILREDGVDVLLNTQASAVAGQSGSGSVTVTTRGADGERELDGSDLLVAAGRTPNTGSLDADKAGVHLDGRGYIQVNDRLETNVPGIFAMGDVTGGPAFTHISYDDFRILRANLLDGGDASTRNRLVPYTVFTDPQLGHVGMHEREARAAGRDIRVARLPMSSVARALEVDETRGMLKAVVDARDGQLLGFTALAIEGGELMSVVEVAMMGHLPYTALRDGVFAHPTLSESLNNLFMALDGQ